MGQVPNQAECLKYTKLKLFYVIILNYINIKKTLLENDIFRIDLTWKLVALLSYSKAFI